MWSPFRVVRRRQLSRTEHKSRINMPNKIMSIMRCAKNTTIYSWEWQSRFLTSDQRTSLKFQIRLYLQYEKKALGVLVNNSNIIYKQTITSYLEKLKIRKIPRLGRWQFRSWIGTGTHMWRIKPVNGIPTLSLLIIGSSTEIQI